MELRKDAPQIAPELGIFQHLPEFPRYKIPNGKDVLEQLYSIIDNQPSNSKNLQDAVIQTSTNLHEIWLDACVPLVYFRIIKKRVLHLQNVFASLRSKSLAFHSKPKNKKLVSVT
jgi:hypothetical protein